MKDRTLTLPRRTSKDPLQVGTAVELTRGLLRGMSGVLIDFRDDNRCLIELNVVPRGISLIIDRAAVKMRRPRRTQVAEAVRQ